MTCARRPRRAAGSRDHTAATWEDTAKHTLARFRAQHARRPDDPSFAALIEELSAASPEFRWRNLAHLAGLDYTAIDPDAPCPPGLLAGAPRTSFGAAISRMVAEEPAAPFRAVAMKLSALPGGLDFTGTPEGLADLITSWWEAGAADGFTLMPHVLPDQLAAFVDHVVPILQRRGLARTEYAGTTLRDHAGLPRPAAGDPTAGSGRPGPAAGPGRAGPAAG